jgi:hypothetical protein
METGKLEGWGRYLLELLWLFTQAIGFGGASLIGYTILAAYKPIFRSPGLDGITPFLSSLATILGTLFLAGSVYLPLSTPRLAWPHSRYYIAWVVVAGCILALYFLITSGTLPAPVVTGFGLLAISGGLKRLMPADIPRPPK